MGIGFLANKRSTKRGSMPRPTFWVIAMLLLLLAAMAGAALQQPGHALASALPSQISKPLIHAPPTPGQPPALPTPLPANLRSMAALPAGAGTQQSQILNELGHPAKALLVSIDDQTLYVYQGSTLLTWSYITTGRPQLQTPRGFYSVLQRQQNVMFYSPWPPSSPNYYSPIFVHYALRFFGANFFLHDFSLRQYYGPGTNVWHQNPDGTWDTGSHGCVETPLAFMQWLYSWATLGTPLVVY